MKLSENKFVQTGKFSYLIEKSRFANTFDYMLVIIERSPHGGATHVTQTVTVDVKTHQDAKDCIIAFSWDSDQVRKSIAAIGGWPHREHRSRALAAAKKIGVAKDNAWIMSQAGLLMIQERALLAQSSEYH